MHFPEKILESLTYFARLKRFFKNSRFVQRLAALDNVSDISIVVRRMPGHQHKTLAKLNLNYIRKLDQEIEETFRCFVVKVGG